MTRSFMLSMQSSEIQISPLGSTNIKLTIVQKYFSASSFNVLSIPAIIYFQILQ